MSKNKRQWIQAFLAAYGLVIMRGSTSLRADLVAVLFVAIAISLGDEQ